MKTEEKLNLTMLCDFYELTMGNGYFRAGLQDRITYFDVFFRNVPDNGGFAVCAGLEQLVQYIQNLHFDEEDIAFLRDKHLFSEDFLSYLRDFRFTGDIWAVPEGTPIFPREPVVTVRAPAIQAQLIETFTLLTINHQSLIATKANRIVRAAQGRTVLEFGSRRAQGTDGAISGARAAYIGGCAGTACTISDQLYGVPAGGTMAHSWVQMFDSQYEAFKTYCQIYPHNATLLVDTYNVLKSGVPDAIRAFDEVLKPLGIRKCGIRLDSGDMAYLTQEARRKLDAAGWTECQISASNSLDEYIIQDLLLQGAKIDVFGVGERMITARSEPVFGGVYKLAAVEDGDGKIIPKIKVSENLDKITIPHFKKTYRILRQRHRQGGGGLHHRLGRDGGRERPTGALRSQGHLEAQDLYELYRKAPSGPGLSGRRAGLSAARPAGDPGLLPCPGGYPVGHGEAVREPSHLLCGSESEAVRHQAGSALPEQMTQQPRPPAGLFVHRILVAECWVFRYNNKISGRS